MRGMLVYNAFLRAAKFTELYDALRRAASELGTELAMASNAELCARDVKSLAEYGFVLFWDKDVQLAMQLEAGGMRVFNSARAIEICDDKALTHISLINSGIPMPKTIILPKTFPGIGYTELRFLDMCAARLGFPLVLKECFGSFGQQVYLMRDMDELRAKVTSLAGTPMLVQELVASSYGRDARINVVGGRVVASMLRTARDGDFRSNITGGGSMRPYAPTDAEAELALNAARLLGLDFAGVDVLFGESGPLLCEVNSNAHFKTTLMCTGVDMAREIMAHVLSGVGG